MITTQELNINNKSYINKDFASIYPELVDLVRKLTERWDPSTSNESDPGVVLLKLMAFISDKDNYNIDKNILERFPLSATQETSMRQLCEMLGYAMGYYKAAETEISFTYTGDKENIILPALDTVITNNDNTVIYTLMRAAGLTKNQTITAPAIQGSLKTLSVSNSDTILLESIDDDHRLYFPESMVAENGIFITGGNAQHIDNSADYWTRVDNLNTQVLGYAVFKFGYDSFKGLPYIEFPEDIASLIGAGLKVRYIVTDGENGNVSAKSLTKLYSPTTINDESFEGDNNGGVLTIRNASAATNGADPESINDAYEGYKKTVGTFDTLVTVRDYANAIYNLYDSLNNHYVSNVQVTDRRTDPNYSTSIVTYDMNGTFSSTKYDDITAFDLVLYPLNPMLSYNQEYYNRSFTPLLDLSGIESEIEGAKSISHDYKELKSSDIYLIKNYLKLNANIATKSKVNLYERLDIINNVKTALYKKFNARNIDYGYEIPFETLLDTIENADERIMSVSLAEPQITTSVMDKEGKESKLLDPNNNSKYIEILAKNVLAGRVKLFNEDKDFAFALGQKASADNKDMIIPNIRSLSTKAAISFASGQETSYTLQDNEVIQLVAPNIITEVTYPYGVNYCWNSADADSLPKDKEFKISNTDTLMIDYTDSDDIEHLYVYGKDTIESYIVRDGVATAKTVISNVDNIFKSSFNIPANNSIDWNATTSTKTISVSGVEYKFMTIKTSDTIEKRKVNIVSLKDLTPCYWVTNKTSNNKYILPFDDSGDYMLQDGEYFFYTDSGYTDIVSLGSGTILHRNGATLTTASSSVWECEQAKLTDVLELGVEALKGKWMLMVNSGDSTFKIEETQILTLTKGDKITISNPAETLNLNNDLVPLTADDITYQIQGDASSQQLTMLNIGDDYKWQIRSRLDINAGPDKAQMLLENQTVGAIYGDDDSTASFGKGESFYLSKDLQLVGSDKIDMSESKIISKYPYSENVYDINLYNYSKGNKTLSNPSGNTTIQIKDGKIDGESSLEYSVPFVKDKQMIMMIYWDGNDGAIKISGTKCGVSYYNSNDAMGAINSGMHMIKLEPTNEAASIEISIADESKANAGNLIIGKLMVFDSLNEQLGLSSLGIEENNFLADLAKIDKEKLFYYNNDYNEKLIEFTDENYMASPYIFYDTNNFYNRFTMSEIDFENSSIDIIRSSRL